MASKEQIYTEVGTEASQIFRVDHNQLQLGMLDGKLKCYSDHPHSPVDYYECFDRIERRVIKDGQQLKAFQEELEDDFTICRFECKGAPPSCLQNCDNVLKTGLLGMYRQYYH
jgi:hypothetical protein